MEVFVRRTHRGVTGHILPVCLSKEDSYPILYVSSFQPTMEICASDAQIIINLYFWKILFSIAFIQF